MIRLNAKQFRQTKDPGDCMTVTVEVQNKQLDSGKQTRVTRSQLSGVYIWEGPLLSVPFVLSMLVTGLCENHTEFYIFQGKKAVVVRRCKASADSFLGIFFAVAPQLQGREEGGNLYVCVCVCVRVCVLDWVFIC